MSYQDLENALIDTFGVENVSMERPAKKSASDGFRRGEFYNPRSDFVVRPFNLDLDIDRSEFVAAFDRHASLFEVLRAKSFHGNQVNFAFNQNPRYFVAVEDETKKVRKHMLGSIINASVLGKIGVVSAADADAYDVLCKMKRYFEFIQERKGLAMAENVLVVKRKDLITGLRASKQV